MFKSPSEAQAGASVPSQLIHSLLVVGKSIVNSERGINFHQANWRNPARRKPTFQMLAKAFRGVG